MSTNYSEQIFQSIDTIISQRLNEVSFDKTEICEIISQDKSDKRKYLVSNGSLKYEAYSDDENKSYLNNQKVYVRISNGDYSLRKIITGSYAADETNENLYVNPFNHLVISEQHHCIMESNKLSAIAYLDNTKDEDSHIIQDLTFYQSGFDNFTYIGLDFSMSTGFGGTTGEFLIIIDLLDNNGVSLLTDKELGLVTLSSKQLYGNPYYLNDKLRFQHLFNFPIGNFSDLTQVKKIKITLVTKGKFNYRDNNSEITIDDLSKVILNDLILYFGFKSSIEKMSKNDVKLVLDNTELLEYTTIDDKKQMSIDWRDLETNAIYNETSNMQYPKFGKYNIYWLQYSESIGFTKRLETTPVDEQEEGIDYIDIAESGTYWKTVKRTDASFANAYIYTLFPATDWKKEQVKVIIKNIETNEYIESNGLTFINTEFQLEAGSNKGKQDTLKLTLAEGDDGIYNNYGIDNKLLSKKINGYTVTVNYVDNTIWNPGLQKVIWKIPTQNSMIKITSFQQDENGNYVELPFEGWKLSEDKKFFEYISNDEQDAQSIIFNISDQFGYNKTNNIISCYIIRYKDENKSIISDEYEGSITLQFGTQGTAGSGYAFNIYPKHYNALTESNQNIFTAKLENNSGENIPIDENNIEWYYMYGDILIGPILSGTVFTVSLEELITNIEGYNCNYHYLIIVAKLTNLTDISGNVINLKAYYPLSIALEDNQYISGPSRIVYDYSGNSPNYDNNPYVLYNSNNEEIEVAKWEIHFPGWDKTDNDNKFIYFNDDGSKTEYWQNYPTLSIAEDGKYYLEPLSSIQTKVLPCSVVAYDNNNNMLWNQPLLIIRNNYAFNILNTWDGNLTINESENQILSQLIGAGVKNEDNTFSGILMGAVSEKNSVATGLYGFSNGELRIKANEKGEFYIGTGEDNKIDFIDDSLTIKIKNFELNASHLLLSSENQNINIYSDESNKELRVAIGKINENIYGLDIYEGSLWLFPIAFSQIKDLSQENRENLASLYFKTEKIGDSDLEETNMYINSKINSTFNFDMETEKDYYGYKYWVSGGTKFILNNEINNMKFDLYPVNTYAAISYYFNEGTKFGVTDQNGNDFGIISNSTEDPVFYMGPTHTFKSANISTTLSFNMVAQLPLKIISANNKNFNSMNDDVYSQIPSPRIDLQVLNYNNKVLGQIYMQSNGVFIQHKNSDEIIISSIHCSSDEGSGEIILRVNDNNGTTTLKLDSIALKKLSTLL